jgi:hypothetical protein
MALRPDDILPLVATLTPHGRLLRLIALPEGADKFVYEVLPPSRDEFSSDEFSCDEEAHAWEAGGCGFGREADDVGHASEE